MATYYVDSSAGDDLSDGLSESGSYPYGPWKTLAKVSGSSFSAGDTIKFRDDCTWSAEQLVLESARHSGSAENPITFTNYGNGTARPKFVGEAYYLTGGSGWTQPEPTNHPYVWKHAAPTEYYEAPDMFLHYDHNLEAGRDHWSTRVYPANANATEADVVNLITTASVFAVFGGSVYLLHYSNPNNGPGVDSSIYYCKHVVVLNGVSYVTIENLTVESGGRNVWIRGKSGTATNITLNNIVSTGGAMGFHCNGQKDAPVSAVTFNNCEASATMGSHGFKVGPDTTDISAQQCDHNTDITLDICTSHGNKACGFQAGLATNVTFSECNAHANSGAFFGAESSCGFMISSTKGCTLNRCKSYNNAAWGVAVERKGANYYKPEAITIQACLVYNNGCGITLSHLAASSYCHLYNNTVANNGSTAAWAGGLVIETNTSIEGSLTVKNNIIANARTDRVVVWRHGLVSGEEDFSNNLYYNSSTTADAFVCNDGQTGENGDYRYAITEWDSCYVAQLSAPREPDTIVGDAPAFADWVVDGGSNDFHLQSGSPAINAGVDVGVSVDIDGTAWDGEYDMGCYHHA